MYSVLTSDIKILWEIVTKAKTGQIKYKELLLL